MRTLVLHIAEREHGVCAKHLAKTLVAMQLEEGVRIVASPGGSRMTLSFGVAEQSMRALELAHA